MNFRGLSNGDGIGAVVENRKGVQGYFEGLVISFGGGCLEELKADGIRTGRAVREELTFAESDLGGKPMRGVLNAIKAGARDGVAVLEVKSPTINRDDVGRLGIARGLGHPNTYF